MKKLIYLSLLLFLSCTKEKEAEMPYPVPQGIFICNEGNHLYGNATLSIYDPLEKTVQNQIYARANNGVAVGDVFQSMKIIDGKGFMVVNNSDKIIVIDLDTYEHIGKIDGLSSPRYIEYINETKMYVSELNSTTITTVNPRTLKVISRITIGSSTEQMVSDNDFVYACSWSMNNKIFRIDSRSNILLNSIEVTKQPNSMVLDKNGKLWVLSDGGYEKSPYGQEIAALTRINTETFTIEQVYKFPDIKFSPSRLSINKEKDTIYFINGGYKSNVKSATNENGVYKMSVESSELPTAPLIPEVGRLFYALGIDTSNGDIYIGDAIDYQQKGIVLRYNSQGELQDMFKTDIIPGSFCFKN